MPRISSALFGDHSSSALGSKGSSNLIEFRAGKMLLNNEQQVVADKRPGLLYVHKSTDGIKHLCWKERNATQAEDDYMVMPDDAIFIPVKKCVDGRVYLLRFRANRKAFFWMQEPNADKDEERVKKLNDIISNSSSGGVTSGPSGLRVGAGSSGLSAGGSRIAGLDFQDILDTLPLSQLNHSELMGLLSSFGVDNSGAVGSLPSSNSEFADASTTAAATAGTSTPVISSSSPGAMASSLINAPKRSNTGASVSDIGGATGSSAGGNTKFSRHDLQKIFSSIKVPDSKIPRNDYPILSDVLRVDDVESVLTPDNLARLQPLLPEVSQTGVEASSDNASVDSNTKRRVIDTMRSPFFKSAVRSFSSALQNGEMGEVVEQFKFSANAKSAAVIGDLVGFCRVLEEDHQTSTSGQAKVEPMEKDIIGTSGTSDPIKSDIEAISKEGDDSKKSEPMDKD